MDCIRRTRGTRVRGQRSVDFPPDQMLAEFREAVTRSTSVKTRQEKSQQLRRVHSDASISKSLYGAPSELYACIDSRSSSAGPPLLRKGGIYGAPSLLSMHRKGSQGPPGVSEGTDDAVLLCREAVWVAACRPCVRECSRLQRCISSASEVACCSYEVISCRDKASRCTDEVNTILQGSIPLSSGEGLNDGVLNQSNGDLLVPTGIDQPRQRGAVFKRQQRFTLSEPDQISSHVDHNHAASSQSKPRNKLEELQRCIGMRQSSSGRFFRRQQTFPVSQSELRVSHQCIKLEDFQKHHSFPRRLDLRRLALLNTMGCLQRRSKKLALHSFSVLAVPVSLMMEERSSSSL